jgi:hypothetical protein
MLKQCNFQHFPNTPPLPFDIPAQWKPTQCRQPLSLGQTSPRPLFSRYVPYTAVPYTKTSTWARRTMAFQHASTSFANLHAHI